MRAGLSRQHDGDMTENDNGSTTTPPQEGTETGPSQGSSGVNSDALRDIRAWRRTIEPDRKVAGVAGGVARALNIDPTIVRVLFVVLAFANGFGLVLYALGWLLMPEEGKDEPLIRASSGVRTALVVGAAALALLVALGVTATIVSGAGHGFFWPLFPTVGVLLLVLWLSQRRDERRTTMSDQTTPPAGAPPASPTEPPAPSAPSYAPPPARRDREPRLFGVTIALLAIGLGSLGIVDSLTAGIVPDSAYAALALAIIGVMLVIGSVFGRANGLVLLGIIAALVLAGTTTSGGWNSRNSTLDATPVTASGVQPDYSLGAGDISLDLSKVADLAALNGRNVTIDLGAGHVIVYVPDDLGVTVDAQVRYGGQVDLPDRSGDGWGVHLTQHVNPQASTQINLTIVVKFGQIEVKHS